MIEIKNLTKIYDKSKMVVKALDDVSLVLPDKGLVFVLGKSGSGKSTFLNMLGGLDNLTSGDIVLNGVSLSRLNGDELDSYRNNYIGIIYQNFNLFPNETVKENILTSSIISNKKIEEKDVQDILQKLDLKEKENVLVKNLSGGQKQRVAIGRALIKNPEMILADEPTGNLDSRTTKTIFDTLKKIAKDKLVVVISHDTKSAENYADRIIKLSDGKIISDEVKNHKYVEPDKKALLIPAGSKITNESLTQINKYLKKHDLKLEKETKQFVPFKGEVETTKQPPVFNKNTHFFKLGMKVSFKFFKNVVASFLVTLIMLTFIIGALSLSQSFVQFDSTSAVSQIADSFDSRSYILNKAYSYYNDPKDINKDYSIQVTEKDIQAFKDGGYTGNIYKIYNTPTITTPYNLNNEVGKVTSLGHGQLYTGIYSRTSLGTVVCDYDYLKQLFGELDVVAGSLYNLENEDDLIVTDYFADSLLYLDKITQINAFISEDAHDPYQKIVNVKLFNRYRIGAVINTGYKERYERLFTYMDRVEREPQNARKIQEEIRKSQIFTTFYDELNSVLNYTYSINPNFQEDYIRQNNTAMWVRNANISYQEDVDPVTYSQNAYFYKNDQLEANSIVMNIHTYNSIFGTNLADASDPNFKVKEIVFSNYEVSQDTTEPPRKQLTLKIVGVADNIGDNSCIGYLDEESYFNFSLDALYCYALAFDNVDESFILYSVGNDIYFYSSLIAFGSIFKICDIIDIFSDIFVFIVIALMIVALIMIVSHNIRTVKKNQYRIGVYKSMGCPSKVFVLSCFVDTALLVATTLISSTVCVLLLNQYVNQILISSFSKFVSSNVISNFVFVSFSLPNLLIYVAVILVVSIISLLAPILYLRKLKPNLILNKAE